MMPIGGGDDYETYRNRYDNLIRPAVESFKRDRNQVFRCVRADLISKTGSITKTVLQYIYTSDLVVADLTTLNPNVFYELGVRHALRHGTLLLALHGTKLPFDVEDLRVVFYRDRVGGEKEATREIHAVLAELVENTPSDSPVFGAIPELAEASARDSAELKAKVSGLESELADARVKLSVAEQTNLALRESASAFERTIATVMEQLHPRAREEAKRQVEAAVRTIERKKVPVVPFELGEVDRQLLFVLMPFRAQFADVYEVIKAAATRVGLRVTRADEMFAPGLITDQVLAATKRAAVIVADVTDHNPNVLYEVGVAHTLGRPTVIIAQVGTPLPFDMAAMRTIFYENTVRGSNRLQDALIEALSAVRGAATLR